MRRRYVLALVVAAELIFALAGCDGSSNSPVESSLATASPTPMPTTAPPSPTVAAPTQWQNVPELVPVIDTCAAGKDATFVRYWDANGKVSSTALSWTFNIRPDETTDEWSARLHLMTEATTNLEASGRAELAWLVAHYPRTDTQLFDSIFSNRDWTPLFHTCLASSLP